MIRRHLGLALACAMLLSGGSVTRADEPSKPDRYWVFVGTYTAGTKSKGIYRFELDLASGKLSGGDVAAEITNPSFLAVAPGNRFLYAVGEIDKVGNKRGGAVSAFALDAKTGRLTPLNQESSGGAGPCHLVVDREGKNVLAANYGGGSVCVLPIRDGGKLGPASDFVQHKGKGPNPRRQEGPHAHSVNVDPSNRYAVVADLGLDQLLVYQFDAARGKLTPNDPPFLAVAPGAGPRHFAFHPTKPYAYVINEMNLTVNALSFDAKTGTFQILQTVSTVPAGTPIGNNSTAEVVVHPSGKFLYGSNRVHNTIAIFALDEDTGKLTPVGHQGMDVKVPRNFNIDPTGQFLIVANQDGDSLVVFRVDLETGKLLPTGFKVEVPKPVCVKFVPKAS